MTKDEILEEAQVREWVEFEGIILDEPEGKIFRRREWWVWSMGCVCRDNGTISMIDRRVLTSECKRRRFRFRDPPFPFSQSR